MKNFIVHIVLGLALLAQSCGISKKARDKEPVQKKVDYGYIQKFHEGVRYKTRGQLNEAIEAFNLCLRVRQDDDAVYYALSQIYLQKNNLELAAENIEKAAKVDPNNIWYVQETAYMYFENGKYDKAAKSFEKLVKKQPRNVDWLYGYAETLVRIGKVEEAIKALDRTEDQVGMHPELTLQKFNLYLQLKQADKGIEEINKARKEFPDNPQLIGTLVDYYYRSNQEAKAVGMLEELTKADPANGRAHLALGDVYRKQGKKKEFYRELKMAFACEDIDLDTKMKILINIHETSYKTEPEVMELVRILVAQYPGEAKAHSILGDYLLREEKELEALEAYKEALKYDKNIYPVWNQVLIMEYQNGRFEELYEDSKVCLTYFPTIPTVYLLNGTSANQISKYKEAVESLSVGKDLIVNDKALEAEFYGQLAEAYFGLNKFEEGKGNYEKALVLDPRSALMMNNFAYRLALAKVSLDRAEELIKKANELSPGQSHFIDTYGWVLFQKGEYTKAKPYFEKAHELKPNDKIIVEHLGDVHFKLGMADKALEYWKKAKELGSANKNLTKKIEKKEYYEPLF